MRRALPWLALVVAVVLLGLRLGKQGGRGSSRALPEKGAVETRQEDGEEPSGAAAAAPRTGEASADEGDPYAPARRDPRLGAALILLDEGRLDAASEALARCEATSPRADVRELAAFFLAQVDFTRGDYPRAKASYLRFLQAHPGSPLGDNARAAVAFVDRFAGKGARP